MLKNNIIIPVVFLIIGFISAYVIFTEKKNNNTSVSLHNSNEKVTEVFSSINPFAEKKGNLEFHHTVEQNRLDYLEEEVSQIKQQLENIELALASISDTAPNVPIKSVNRSRNRFPSILSMRLYNLENLIRGGISSTVAEDIVRRKNSIELKRLELQDRAKREDYLDTQRYFDELNNLNQQDVDLRKELGDERYDEYLYTSKQNNRVRVASVMLGSAAEQSGLQKGDIVLSYDNKQMFSWRELKNATTEGQLGEFISVNIVREGEIYSFTVPRGPLGIQLGMTRLAP